MKITHAVLKRGRERILKMHSDGLGLSENCKHPFCWDIPDLIDNSDVLRNMICKVISELATCLLQGNATPRTLLGTGKTIAIGIVGLIEAGLQPPDELDKQPVPSKFQTGADSETETEVYGTMRGAAA